MTAQSQLDFRVLFEGSPDVLLVLLPDAPKYTMVAATDARLQATHTTRDETMGHGLFEIFPDNPDDADAADGGSGPLNHPLLSDLRGPPPPVHLRAHAPRPSSVPKAKVVHSNRIGSYSLRSSYGSRRYRLLGTIPFHAEQAHRHFETAARNACV